MNLIVIGCGRIGADLAYRLFQRGHKVAVIDRVAAAFENLPADFRGRTVEGEPLDLEVLHRAGMDRADGVAAVTNSDSLNAVVAHLARTVYHLDNVVVRNYDPHWRSVHEAFGARVVSSAAWGAQQVEDLLHHRDRRSVFSAGSGEVVIYELVIPETWQGRKLRDLLPKDQSLPVALTRAGQALLPARQTRLQTGDVLHLSATREGIEAVRARLAQPEEV